MAGYQDVLFAKGYNGVATINKYTAVKLSANDTVVPVAASTDIPLGVALNSILSTDPVGKGVSVIILGIAEMEVGAGGVTVGTEVMCDTSGKAIAAVTTGNIVLGVCLITAIATNRTAVLLRPGRKI